MRDIQFSNFVGYEGNERFFWECGMCAARVFVEHPYYEPMGDNIRNYLEFCEVPGITFSYAYLQHGNQQMIQGQANSIIGVQKNFLKKKVGSAYPYFPEWLKQVVDQGQTSYFNSLCVPEHLRKQGIGTALIEDLSDLAQSKGMQYDIARVHKDRAAKMFIRAEYQILMANGTLFPNRSDDADSILEQALRTGPLYSGSSDKSGITTEHERIFVVRSF